MSLHYAFCFCLLISLSRLSGFPTLWFFEITGMHLLFYLNNHCNRHLRNVPKLRVLNTSVLHTYQTWTDLQLIIAQEPTEIMLHDKLYGAWRMEN